MKKTNKDWIESIANYVGDTLQTIGSDNRPTQK